MNNERPVSLYLVVRPADKDRLKPLMRLLLNQIVRVLTREEMRFKEGQSEKRYKHRLLLMLDEFPSFCCWRVSWSNTGPNWLGGGRAPAGRRRVRRLVHQGGAHRVPPGAGGVPPECRLRRRHRLARLGRRPWLIPTASSSTSARRLSTGPCTCGCGTGARCTSPWRRGCRGPASRCMDCAIPFLQQPFRLPPGQPCPRLERPRLSRPLARRHRALARDQ